MLRSYSTILLKYYYLCSYYYYSKPMSNRTSIPFWTLLNAGYATVGREWNYSKVYSPFTRLYYVTEGRGYIQLVDRTIILEPGKFYIIPAFTVHTNRCDNTMSHYYLHVYEDWEDPRGSVTDFYIFPDSMDYSEGLAQIFIDTIRINSGLGLMEKDPHRYGTFPKVQALIDNNSQMSIGVRMINNGLISILMGAWISVSEDKHRLLDEKISKVMDYIHQHLYTRFSIDDCAEAVSLSRFHLLHKFKEYMGTSLMNYVQFQRIRNAQIDLVMTSKSIKEISVDSGYDDVNYFIRQFRKHTGLPPGAYRRMNLSYRQ